MNIRRDNRGQIPLKKPRKGLKLKEKFFVIERPSSLDDIYLFRYAGTFFGQWHIEGCFLLVDNIFLDTGNPNFDPKPFSRFVKTLDRARDWTILNTHMHEDHCGKNRLLQKKLNCRIYSPEIVSNFGFVSPLMDLVWGRPRMFTAAPLDRDVYETDRGRIIEVIPTPGHSPNHTAYRIMPDDIVYSGDAIPVPRRKRYVTMGEDYISELESLHKLLDYAERGSQFISAHHGIVEDSISLIDERITGMTDVVKQVKEQAASGISDPVKICRHVFGAPEFMYRHFGTSLRCREDWTVESIIQK